MRPAWEAVTPTAKKSIDIEIPCPAMTAADRDAVVAVVLAAAERQSLLVTLTTTHTSFPDSIHWHFKPERRIRGVLDLTYWPDGGRLWLSVRSPGRGLDRPRGRCAGRFAGRSGPRPQVRAAGIVR